MTVLSIINSTYKSTDTSLECKFQKEEEQKKTLLNTCILISE